MGFNQAIHRHLHECHASKQTSKVEGAPVLSVQQILQPPAQIFLGGAIKS